MRKLGIKIHQLINYVLCTFGLILAANSGCQAMAQQTHSREPALTKPPEQPARKPLMIQLAKPPSWKNSCLQISILRVNASSAPIFVPVFPEILIYSSVIDDTNTLGQGKGQAWLPVSGASDIAALDMVRLAPGEAKQSDYCIEDSFTVLQSRNKARRQVPLRGKLRFLARYYLGAPEWLTGKHQSAEKSDTPTNERSADRWSGDWVRLEVPIPCHKEPGNANCTTPPPVFEGEVGILIPPIE